LRLTFCTSGDLSTRSAFDSHRVTSPIYLFPVARYLNRRLRFPAERHCVSERAIWHWTSCAVVSVGRERGTLLEYAISSYVTTRWGMYNSVRFVNQAGGVVVRA